MKTKTQLLLLFLISISLFSCNNAVKNSATVISNLDTDFPTTEDLEFKPFNKYDILFSKEGYCVIDDSTLWFIGGKGADFGFCYNLNTGEKLSTIAFRGRAANELTELDYFDIIGDSVLLYTSGNTIKTFAKKEIIDNVPMGDRKCSVISAPDSILVYRMTKLPNGSILATISSDLYGFNKKDISEANQKSVAVFNKEAANFYETIKYESFDVENENGVELAANDLIKCAYSNGSIEIKDNDMAVFSVSDQFILYTFDVKSGNVISEKRYTNMQRSEGEGSISTKNDRGLSLGRMKTCSKYILCVVHGYLSEEDKDAKLGKDAIFVFDWKLNPIKKFALPNRENGYYIISNDCKSVYFCQDHDDGIVLDKADLNI